MARLAVEVICAGWALYTASWVEGAATLFGFFGGLWALGLAMIVTAIFGGYIRAKLAGEL